jgi:hypothetical protein
MERDISIFLAGIFTEDEIEKGTASMPKKELKNRVCGYCHREMACIPLKKSVPSTLLLRGFFYNEGLCKECAHILGYGAFRKSNFVVESGKIFTTFKHISIWDGVLKAIFKPPYYISLTTSYKKHNLFYTRVNRTNNEKRYLVFNQHEIIYSLKDDMQYFDIVYSLYNEHKQTKEAIEMGNIVTAYLDNIEYQEVKKLYKKIEHLKGSFFLNLLVTYVPNIKKGKKHGE